MVNMSPCSYIRHSVIRLLFLQLCILFCVLVLLTCPSFCLYACKTPNPYTASFSLPSHTHMFVPSQFLFLFGDELPSQRFPGRPCLSASPLSPHYSTLLDAWRVYTAISLCLPLPCRMIYTHSAYNRNRHLVNSVWVLALIIILKLPVSKSDSSTDV